jgi:uncharacterized protein (DUF58 family)
MPAAARIGGAGRGAQHAVGRAWAGLAARWSPRRTIRPTREGWWCLAVTVGLGVTALNTGNNLLYLLESMVLALIVVSGVLSEQSVRGVQVEPVLPDEIFAGTPCAIAARVRNTSTWRPSFSIALDRPDTGQTLAYLTRLGPGEQRLVTWDETLPHRGRHRLAGVRPVTRFPFGLFVKAARATARVEVLVYPRRVPPPPALVRQAAGAGHGSARRRGRGDELHDLRAYRPGDDPRLVHWRATARTGALTVRELEAQTAHDACLVLRGDGRGDPERLEQALAEAAAGAGALMRHGARVALVGPGVEVPLGHGPGHARRLLTALALFEPAGASVGRVPDGVRVITVDLG